MLNFVYDIQGRLWQAKAAASNLDYTVDWSQWLEGDTIASVTVTGNGVTIGTTEFTSTQVSFMVSGGTLNTIASVVVEITTAIGRIEQQTFYLNILNY